MVWFKRNGSWVFFFYYYCCFIFFSFFFSESLFENDVDFFIGDGRALEHWLGSRRMYLKNWGLWSTWSASHRLPSVAQVLCWAVDVLFFLVVFSPFTRLFLRTKVFRLGILYLLRISGQKLGSMVYWIIASFRLNLLQVSFVHSRKWFFGVATLGFIAISGNAGDCLPIIIRPCYRTISK